MTGIQCHVLGFMLRVFEEIDIFVSYGDSFVQESVPGKSQLHVKKGNTALSQNMMNESTCTISVHLCSFPSYKINPSSFGSKVDDVGWPFKPRYCGAGKNAENYGRRGHVIFFPLLPSTFAGLSSVARSPLAALVAPF